MAREYSSMESMVMNIFLTGATGFIGINLIPKLLKYNHTVIALKRVSSDLSKLQLYIDNRNLIFYNLEENQLSRIFQETRIDMVIHLATYYRKSHIKDEIDNMIHSNIEFPTEILQQMIEHGVRYFINTGTFFEYALESNNPITETCRINPYNLYAATKVAFEDILKYYIENYSISAATLRLFAPYGPFDHKSKIIPYIIKNVSEKIPIKFNSSGFQKWDYVFIQDVTEAFKKTIEFIINNDVKHEVFNIGSGKTVSLREVFQYINQIAKTKIEATWGQNTNKEINYVCADITKTKKLLKWEPCFDIYKGLEITYKWFTKNEIFGAQNENY
ncbi:MAG: NAD(P)-dependent oxidoreductase [Deltaproteobacteria bacterium]|nr:NAD(P)-dependent oxidoreductase [Deltaproteobacteria bacterium]